MPAPNLGGMSGGLNRTSMLSFAATRDDDGFHLAS
jgi:hypothetical protein